MRSRHRVERRQIPDLNENMKNTCQRATVLYLVLYKRLT